MARMNPQIFLRRLPRWLNRIYARVFGYFWFPCPICGRDFGGHEAAEEALLDPKATTVLLLEDGHNGWYWSAGYGQMNCWRCDDFVRKENPKRALAILGPERFREAFEATRDAHCRKIIDELGVPSLIVGEVEP